MKQNELMSTLAQISNTLVALDKRLSKIENSGKPTSIPKGIGKGKGSPEKPVAKTATKSIKDFEPKKGADKQYVWASYKAQRKAYCYYVATDGKATTSDQAYKKGIAFSDIKADYDKAKTAYGKKYPYTCKADR